MNNVNSAPESGELDFSLEFSGSELQLIQRLKLGDWEKDSALREAYAAWVDACHAECEKDKSALANLRFLMKRAKLLYTAGMLDEAWREFMDARTLADNLGLMDIVDEANVVLLKIAES